jgi:hypothetical protein
MYVTHTHITYTHRNVPDYGDYFAPTSDLLSMPTYMHMEEMGMLTPESSCLVSQQGSAVGVLCVCLYVYMNICMYACEFVYMHMEETGLLTPESSCFVSQQGSAVGVLCVCLYVYMNIGMYACEFVYAYGGDGPTNAQV